MSDFTQWRESLPKFWSDDFDADLLNVFPNVRAILGATIDVPIWTVGHTTHDRLNHPATWNGFGAFMWLEKPNLVRDKHGWFNVQGCVADSPEIEATWLEWLRDAWSHSYAAILLPTGERFGAVDFNRCFAPIMYKIRNHPFGENSEASRALALKWLTRCNLKFARAVETFRLGRAEHPYFAPGSVPGEPVTLPGSNA